MSVAGVYVEVKVNGRLNGKETVGAQCGQHIHQEIMKASVSAMHQLGDILEHIVEGFYDASFTQHHLVIEWHELLLHVCPQACDNMYALIEKPAEKTLGDISLVCVKFAEHPICQGVNDILLTVVDIGLGYDKIDYLPVLIAQQVEFESYIPSHGAFAFVGYAFEYLHLELPFIMYDRYGGTVNKTYSCALAKTTELKEHGHGDETFRHNLNESVIGKRSREEMFPMLADSTDIVMFKITVCVEMETD